MKIRIDRLRALLPNHADGKGGTGSRTERDIFKIVERVLSSQPGYTVESNVWLDGCFGADIVITRLSPDGSKSVFNIEVDGPIHSRPTSQRLDRRRDQHLQEACGVRIARIPLLQPTGQWLQSGEYEAAVQAVFEHWQLMQPPSAKRADPKGASNRNIDDVQKLSEKEADPKAANHRKNEEMPEKEADSRADYHRNIDNVDKLSAASRPEPSKNADIDSKDYDEGDNEGTSCEHPFLAAATSRKWRVSGKKRYLKKFYQQVDDRTIDKARLVSKQDDPAGYMTLVDMLRDSWARNEVVEEELPGIIARYSD
jgi:hypothetical protein